MGREIGAHQRSAGPIPVLHHFCHGKLECVLYGRDNRKILQIHDVTEEWELLLGPRGTEWLMRGICGRRGFVQRIAVALFDGVLECMVDATPGHCSWMRLGSPLRRRRARSRHADSGGGTVRPGRVPFAGKRCLWNLACWQGDCVRSVTWILRTVNNDAGVRIQEIQGAIEVSRKWDCPFPQAVQGARKEHAAPPPNEARC
ncbi:hypothetical protein MOQ_004512 [Trypanosoma cruzi marinkellei]|uniref:Uncharacterized protein n=1 Tax=Trypanosoma cruzi marinkellei TaxID=85056 RepID=K2M9E2_TRYCR|nr:hypothetical protein MOQ_004512 [Trypanosoma cruzi marinkellei]